MRHPALLAALIVASHYSLAAAAEPEFSGIYPHLAYANKEGECGTGAVVPWAGKLWVITYGPHLPNGSSDKLYEIDDQLQLTIRPESVGGTPANRLIHRESQQLFIGPYAIDKDRNVRVIKPKEMPGRLTGIARHLTDPAGKVYYATMEEGFYEVDVKSLAVKELFRDANGTKNPGGDLLPGYHGKGLYSGQGRLIYANNGEKSSEALRKPDIPSGCLAEWSGKPDKDWAVVRRNQFTDVTGPGGIEGNANPETDPVWSIGWDHRSLMLLMVDGGKWYTYRLPKSSHSYDGAHGWNTEWPRIREIGGPDLLMTMHGAFWHFPKTFSAANSVGISMRSNYLKVVGDFCLWNNRLVLGCDDSAKSEFLNKRKAKGEVAAPGMSHSNLWFLDPADLDKFGPALGRGAVWLGDEVKANTPSDPFLFTGFQRRAAFLAHEGAESVTFTLEVDVEGNGKWQKLRDVPVKSSTWIAFTEADKGQWIRVRASASCHATALFTGSNADKRETKPDEMFAGLATVDSKDFFGGVVHARGTPELPLSLATVTVKDGKPGAETYYEVNAAAKLAPVNDAAELALVQKNRPAATGAVEVDEASVITIEGGRRWRLPKGDAGFDAPHKSPLPLRVCREVCTERDLFQVHGTFYELPAENAGSFTKLRPVASHRFLITDYCSWRGLLVLTGIAADAPETNKHIVRSADGQAAVWLGGVDDLWKLGKPVGHGGPWKNTAVKAGKESDPYLFTGYDKKSLTLSHTSPSPVTMTVELDISGAGDWLPYQEFEVAAGKAVEHEFPAALQAYWLRVKSSADCTATAQLKYE